MTSFATAAMMAANPTDLEGWTRALDPDAHRARA
jgi:hypothetical protein